MLDRRCIHLLTPNASITFLKKGKGLDDKEPVTPNWIYMMENQNIVPNDEGRRWLLARLLDIPPILFGLEPLNALMSGLFVWETVDIQEYRLTLENYSRGWHAGSVFPVDDIKKRISNLYHEAPHSPEKKEMLKMLCGYLILLGDLAFDHMESDTAIDNFSRAVTIAKQEKLYDLWVFALRQRGLVYMEQGEITAGLKGYPAAQRYFAKAVLNAQAAQNLEMKVQPMLRGLVLSNAGIAYATVAQNESEEFKKALEILDQAQAHIGKKADDVGITAILDEERYHLDRAHTYLAYPAWNASHANAAQIELEQAAKMQTLNSLDRKTSYASRLAKSYLVGGQYEMAVAYTEDALSLIQASSSTMKLVRLDMIYQNLRKSPYGTSADVKLLGTKLLKVQRPELFH
jgi:tetratricopeptide (TPR) repeat protein